MSQAFIHFAHQHGVEIDPSKLDDSGRIRRCPTAAHPRSKNGSYTWDGRSGWVWAWDGKAEAIGFNDPNARPMSPEEEARRARMRAARQAQQDHQHHQAAEWATRMLGLAKPGPHGYLQRKGLGDTPGLTLPEGELFVPMRSLATNALVGAQIVQWLPQEMRWEKKYLYGMRSRGAVLRLGPRTAAELVLCEGYATGLSIVAAVGQMRLNAAVLVTFSDSNLKYVAAHTAGRRYVIADNDPVQTDPEKAKQNAGEQGQRAAAATGLGWAMSDAVGEDANDLHARAGLMAVCALVMAARRAEPSNPWATPAEAAA